MRISFFEHAVDRMQKRGIPVEVVQAVLSKPDGKIRQSADKWIFFKHISGRFDNLIAIVVVQSKEEPSVEVITVMNHFEVTK